jgi:uncharacterized membrane protein
MVAQARTPRKDTALGILKFGASIGLSIMGATLSLQQAVEHPVVWAAAFVFIGLVGVFAAIWSDRRRDRRLERHDNERASVLLREAIHANRRRRVPRLRKGEHVLLR